MTHKTSVVEIKNADGLHARPSASFVKTANQFSSTIFVEKNGEKANGKSIIGLMTLAATRGNKIKITANGPDATDAVKALEKLVNSQFGESN